MPRYHLHVHDDLDARDEEGVELPDLDAARPVAVKQARALIGETMKEHGRFVLHHRIDIEDTAGSVLGTVWFNDVVFILG